MVDRVDAYGHAAWVGLMVLAFILFWPVGLGLLAFLLGSGRMGCGGRWSGEDRRERFERKMNRMRERFEAWGSSGGSSGGGFGGGPGWHTAGGFAPSGNRAFDAYREDTLRRLEEEATEFRSFLDRLRMAKDKSEFDQFMADQRARPPGPASDAGSGEPRPQM